jgi:hypothetical protein
MAIACERRISSVVVALLLSSLSLGDARAQAAPETKSIFDSPPARDKPAMTAADQLKLKKDLTAVRDRRGPHTKTKAPKAPPARPAKP